MLTRPARRVPRVLTLLTSVFLLVVGVADPVSAEPGEDGGQNLTVRQALDKAMGEYNDAKGRLDKSLADEATLGTRIADTQTKVAALQATAGTVAGAAYRGRRVSLANVLIASDSPDTMMRGMVTVQYMLERDDKLLRELAATRKDLERQKTEIAAAIANQQAQLKIMEANKKAAEDALKKAGGGASTTGPGGGNVTTKPGDRNTDGSYSGQGCGVDDPTTGGCITPRMLTAYNEARKAGFTRYTSCHRSGGGGDHPKGKACDFSSNATTFLNSRATGGDKTYGDNLAAWCVANAKNLGVKYVIWYKRIWQPSSGWKTYGGDGTPAGDHYNHVHLSMQ